jgi:hypothetical protein
MITIKFYATKNIYRAYNEGGNYFASSTSKAKLIQKLKDQFNIIYSEEVKTGTIAKSEFTVKQRFDFISTFTKLVSKGVMNSLVITGDGGLGKTHTVLETLEKLGLKEDTIGEIDGDFVFIKGYSTPRNLYTSLYHNNGKTIVFDDCDNITKDAIGANILKAALDSYERRIVSWGAENKDDSVPSRFEFTGKVIFISNLVLDKFPQAILSRSMLVDLSLNQEEKIERIQQVFDSEDLYEAEDKTIVLDFIKRNVAKAKDLNIRSAMNLLKIKLALGKNWELPALYNFSTN